MIKAEQWSEKLGGETSPQAIRMIQADAIAYALTVVGESNWAVKAELARTLDVLCDPNAGVQAPDRSDDSQKRAVR